jgi:3-deoxy-D-manno-octulosonic-acid transferase
MKKRVSVKRPAYDEWKRLRKHMNLDENSIVITAGCIHAEEGATIREALDRIAEMKLGWKWIVVPRYLDDVPVIMTALGADAVLSRETFITRDWRVCVIGAYGVLEDLYRIADAAVVGGGFADAGGHNVWEAAQFAIPVFWGPHCYEQRESCETLAAAGVGFETAGGNDLSNTMFRVMKTEAKLFITAQQAFLAAFAGSADSLEQVIP